MINKKVLLGGIGIAGVLLLYFYLLLNGISYKQEVSSTQKANLEVIPAESIPTVAMGLLVVTPTYTAIPVVEVNGISIQEFVKIQGTEGVGLRVRDNPGTDSEVVFLANESEVFIVIGGPEEADGILWWELTTPYDETRSGWASADYLVAISEE